MDQKIIFFLIQQNSEKNQNLFHFIIEKLNQIDNYYGLINIVFIIILFIIIIIVLFFSKHRCNKKSKNELEKNKKNGKFINELYIELGSCNEKLRYIYFNKKWKNRIRKEFKTILKTNIGQMLRKSCNIRFYNIMTLRGLRKSLKKCKTYIENIRKNNIEEDKNKNYNFYLEMNSYYVKYDILRLLENIEMIDNNICFVLGKAGSGKTNLLTYFAEKLICNFKAQCIYIDAKDIVDNNLEDKVFSYFYCNYLINENKKFLISLLLILKRIFKQEIVIIIEAINENSNIEFYKNLSRFLNKYHKYNNMKIIISSRTEFYNLRFKEIFNEYLEEDVQYKIISIENSRINNIIYEKMFLKYKNFFKFNGSITHQMKMTLFESPIFMRIFFECYKNSNENISYINKSKLFSKYISKLSKRYSGLKELLDKIVDIMLEEKKFDYVKIERLSMEVDTIQNLTTENLLLMKSIVENEGEINESQSEIVAITYDEIRDYLITNRIIKKYKKEKNKIIDFIDEIIEKRYPILEGVLKRIYIYFKQYDTEICNHILNKNTIENYSYGNKDTYNNINLDFIFSTGQNLISVEEKYLSTLKYISPNDLAKMIFDCTYNFIHGLSPEIDFIQTEMLKFISGDGTVFDFSKISIDSYKSFINQLKNINNPIIENYIETLNDLLKYLEMNYYD